VYGDRNPTAYRKNGDSCEFTNPFPDLRASHRSQPMSIESMMKRAEKLASLFHRRAEVLHELKEVDDEIDRVQLGRGYEDDQEPAPGPNRRESGGRTQRKSGTV